MLFFAEDSLKDLLVFGFRKVLVDGQLSDSESVV
jgi:hypothetical protein